MALMPGHIISTTPIFVGLLYTAMPIGIVGSNANKFFIMQLLVFEFNPSMVIPIIEAIATPCCWSMPAGRYSSKFTRWLHHFVFTALVFEFVTKYFTF